MKIDHEYFLTEFHAFREIMCSTKYTPEQKYDAWGGLLRVYFLCESSSASEAETRKTAIGMLAAEFPLRMSLEETAKLEALALQLSMASLDELRKELEGDNEL